MTNDIQPCVHDTQTTISNEETSSNLELLENL